MKHQPLRYYMHDGPTAFRFELTGCPAAVSGRNVVTLLLLAIIVFPIEADAATLKPETVTAWDDYLRSASATPQDRLRSGGSFLWTFEDAERAAKVPSGEIVVAPVGQNPKKVSGGLIGAEDRFWMLLMNKAFFLKTALATDYLATKVRRDDRRFYSISRTTRVQEVDEYGQPGEHRKPEGEGSGYIWKLYSVARLEERDDGVSIELEAMALSRKIPDAFRVVADPIVRRVSRNSLLISLKQTGEAVSGKPATAE